MNKSTILIIEDDRDLASLTAEFLQDYEFICHHAYTASEAVDYLDLQQPDLIILDLMLPDSDGLELCRQIKSRYDGKIMIFTARKDTIDQVLGLELGADDYVTKPIEPRLLLAKCRALLRRANGQVAVDNKSQNQLEIDNIHIDMLRREVRLDGALVDMSNPEYELLLLLISRRGEIVSRNEISLNLRGVEYDGQSRKIDILISSIRAKLGDNVETPALIKTVRAKGYVFIR